MILELLVEKVNPSELKYFPLSVASNLKNFFSTFHSFSWYAALAFSRAALHSLAMISSPFSTAISTATDRVASQRPPQYAEGPFMAQLS